jgi:hypothetical protein
MGINFGLLPNLFGRLIRIWSLIKFGKLISGLKFRRDNYQFWDRFPQSPIGYFYKNNLMIVILIMGTSLLIPTVSLGNLNTGQTGPTTPKKVPVVKLPKLVKLSTLDEMNALQESHRLRMQVFYDHLIADNYAMAKRVLKIHSITDATDTELKRFSNNIAFGLDTHDFASKGNAYHLYSLAKLKGVDRETNLDPRSKREANARIKLVNKADAPLEYRTLRHAFIYGPDGRMAQGADFIRRETMFKAAVGTIKSYDWHERYAASAVSIKLSGGKAKGSKEYGRLMSKSSEWAEKLLKHPNKNFSDAHTPEGRLALKRIIEISHILEGDPSISPEDMKLSLKVDKYQDLMQGLHEDEYMRWRSFRRTMDFSDIAIEKAMARGASPRVIPDSLRAFWPADGKLNQANIADFTKNVFDAEKKVPAEIKSLTTPTQLINAANDSPSRSGNLVGKSIGVGDKIDLDANAAKKLDRLVDGGKKALAAVGLSTLKAGKKILSVAGKLAKGAAITQIFYGGYVFVDTGDLGKGLGAGLGISEAGASDETSLNSENQKRLFFSENIKRQAELIKSVPQFRYWFENQFYEQPLETQIQLICKDKSLAKLLNLQCTKQVSCNGDYPETISTRRENDPQSESQLDFKLQFKDSPLFAIKQLSSLEVFSDAKSIQLYNLDMATLHTPKNRNSIKKTNQSQRKYSSMRHWILINRGALIRACMSNDPKTLNPLQQMPYKSSNSAIEIFLGFLNQQYRAKHSDMPPAIVSANTTDESKTYPTFSNK